MEETSYVVIEKEAPLATVYINRPAVLNAYNEDMLIELEEVAEELIEDDNIQAIIITGCGNKAFTVGADIEWLEGLDSKKAKEISRRGQIICNIIEQSSKVFIAAVNGYALGGGMELALACDLRYASTRARFGQPEVRLGMVPGFDGAQRLPRLIGVGLAKELLFTGHIIDAEEANQIGLVNKVVTPRDLLEESKKIAREISDQSSFAVSLIKDIVNYGLKHGPEYGSEYETEAFGNCFENNEHLKRIQKLKENIHK